MKMMKTGLALLVALLLAMNCVFALAEETAMDVSGIAIGNVQMYVNDELAADFSGLTLKLDAGQSADGSRLAARATVMGGDEVAAQAVIAGGEEQNKLALNVTGMSQPVTLDMAVLQQLFSEEGMQQLMDQLLAELSDEERAAVEELFAALTEMFSEEGLDGMSEAFETYVTKGSEIMANDMTQGEEAVEHEFLYSGETKEAATAVIDVPADDFDAILQSALECYDSIPGFLKLVNALNKLSGETTEVTSFASVMDMEEMPKFAMRADVYAATDGTETEMYYTVSADGEEVLYMTLVIAQDGEDVIVSCNFTAADEDTTSFRMTLVQSPNEALADVTDCSVVFSGMEGTSDEFNMVLWYSPDEDYDVMFGGQIEADGSTVGAAYGGGEAMKSVSVYADDMSIEMGWIAGDEADTLYLSANEDEDNYYISADLTHYTETISVDEIDAILNAEGIDVMTIDDATMETIGNELASGMTTALVTLINNVPAIADLMSASTAE